MKVHITSTPEYSKENINSVVEVLSQVPGELQFVSGESLSIEDIRLRFPDFETPQANETLSFKDFFLMADLYRALHIKSSNETVVKKDDFVVLITKIPNDKEWFSSNSNRHIFVNANGWEYITDQDSKYGIAYQIVENIFQSLSGIDVTNPESDPNIHQKSIGCVNDMCEDEKDVILKLRTGYICNSCLNRALTNEVDPIILLHIQSLIFEIRKGLMNFDIIRSEIVPPILIINKEGEITISDKPIDLEAAQKTLFIFYLKNPKGVKFEELEDHLDELYHIYLIIKPTGDYSTVKNLSLPSANGSSTFLKTKSHLNKSLIRQLGEQVSEFYVINRFDSNGETMYKINLNPDYRKIDPRF